MGSWPRSRVEISLEVRVESSETAQLVVSFQSVVTSPRLSLYCLRLAVHCSLVDSYWWLGLRTITNTIDDHNL